MPRHTKKKEEQELAETNNQTTQYPKSVMVDLRTVEVGSSVKFNIESVRTGISSKTGDDFIVATVSSEEIEGNTIWFKGKFGLQNGYASLLKAFGGVIEGHCVYHKVESKKSPVGYAHRWTLE
jgi:hypothetical protein